jgi:hypothetical protein
MKTLYGGTFEANPEEVLENPFTRRYFSGYDTSYVQLLGEFDEPLGVFKTTNTLVNEGDTHSAFIADVLSEYLKQTDFEDQEKSPVDIHQFFNLLDALGYERIIFETIKTEIW